MTSSILFAGGEDIDFISVSGYGSSSVNGTVWRDTTAGHFRSGYARYSIGLPWSNANSAAFNAPAGAYTSANFWLSFQCTWSFGGTNLANNVLVFYDSGGTARLALQCSTGGVYNFGTYNNAGTFSVLGSSVSINQSGVGVGTLGPISKFDVHIVYGTSGSITMYQNGTQIYTFTGDNTTNSATILDSRIAFASMTAWNSNTGTACYSEIIVSTRDTRNFSLVTQAPTANGNTHNWDGGTAANISATSMTTGQVSPNYSGTAAQIQEYQVTPAIPTGNFSIISVVQKAQATVGASGPTKFEFMVRTGATDYTSSPDTAPVGVWATYSYNWDTNPNTTNPWQTSELPASSTSFNMGLKSVT